MEYKKVKCSNALDIPSKTHFHKNGIYVSESLIPYDYETATIIFFVSGDNGDEFGQFPSLQKALDKAREVVGQS